MVWSAAMARAPKCPTRACGTMRRRCATVAPQVELFFQWPSESMHVRKVLTVALRCLPPAVVIKIGRPFPER
eukprot:412574-Lingulodinium_polyedra.AAC.1